MIYRIIADVLVNHNLTQQEFAEILGIGRHRLNEVTNRKRSITPVTALRLARVINTSATVGLREQARIDLWDAMHGPAAKQLAKMNLLKRRRLSNAKGRCSDPHPS